MNAETNPQAIATINSTGRDLVSPKGRVTGRRIAFIQGETVKGIKEALRAANPNLKGNALSKAVNGIIKGEKDKAWVIHAAFDEYMRGQGFSPTYGDIRAKTGVVRYVKPTEPKQKAAKAPSLADMKSAVGKLTPAEKAELLGLIQSEAEESASIDV